MSSSTLVHTYTYIKLCNLLIRPVVDIYIFTRFTSLITYSLKAWILCYSLSLSVWLLFFRFIVRSVSEYCVCDIKWLNCFTHLYARFIVRSITRNWMSWAQVYFFPVSHRLTVILNLNSAICLITVLLFSGFFNEVTNNWYRNRNFFRSYRALSILLLFSNHFYHMVSNWLSIGLLNCIFQFVYLAAHHNRSHQNTFDKIWAVLKY